MVTVGVEVRQVGRRSAVVESRPMPLALAPGTMPVRDLVAAVVEEEVLAYRARMAERSVTTVLTDGAIGDGIAVGKVASGDPADRVPDDAGDGRQRDDAGREGEGEGEVEVAAAVEVALLAHADGLYQVVIDDVPMDSLDDRVLVSEGMTILFIRLVALTGG